MKYNYTSRIRFISWCLLFVALLFVARLYLIQVVDRDLYVAKGNHQYVNPNNGIFSRGTIYFTNKDETLTSAATVKSGFTLALSPKEFKASTTPEDIYEKISKILPLDKTIFISKAEKKDDPYEEIAKRVDEETGKKIDALSLNGVQVINDRWRFYPGNSSAAQLLGFIGFKNDETTLSGRYGLERYYDDVLNRGETEAYTNFFAEIFSNAGKKILDGSELEGDLVTTIEPSVQTFLENTLDKVEKKWNSELSGGVIINPKTGEIYAMAVTPSFNPNNFQSQKDPAIFSNPIVENVYEMGSIVKPLTVASGIDAGVITPETTYNDKGFMILNGSRISNFDGKGRGIVSMQEVLNQSLNTGATYVALKMGHDNFKKYMLSYGLGEETGIDLPNETHGLVNNLDSPRDIEYATVSYGQGIAMTPIETVRALCTIANGGFLITPHVAKEIRYKVGYSKEITYEANTQVLKKETSEKISRMLTQVVDKALLDGAVKMKEYSIAAKTGTAQIANPKGGGYYSDRYLHSFFGYFPSYDPKFLVFLYTVYPKGVNYASHTLTYPFIDITKYLINYYDIPPDRGQTAPIISGSTH